MDFRIKDIIIVINSSHRAGQVIVNKCFPSDLIRYTIAVPSNQYNEYVNEYGAYLVTEIDDCVAPNLPAQRQWCMEYFVGYKYIWFMDDDLKFLWRDKDLKLHNAEEKDIRRMFKAMWASLKEVPVVGISTRLGNNRVIESSQYTNRVTRCYAIERTVYESVGCRFDPIDNFVAEDFHVALCMLNAGYNNKILFDFAQEDGGSNKGGGCSLYRTADVQRKTAFWMAENHPEVRVQTKSSKNWNNMDGLKGQEQVRVDMVVQWKQAYKPKTRAKNRLF